MKQITFLNLTQFLGAFNDNLFKFGLAFFLIDLEGVENSAEILSLSSAIFVLPFIFFGAPAGQLADKISKSRLIVFTKFLELLVMALSCISFYFHLKWFSFFLLFMMAFQSTLFGPAKYGIIPELVPMKDVSKANGVITAFTFLAIILGSGSASLILDVTGKSYMTLMLTTLAIASIGIAASLCIPYMKAVKKDGTVDANIFKTIVHSSKEMHKNPPLLAVALASVYFLFVASFVQLNMIPFAHTVMHLNILYGGYLFFLASLGIAFGAYMVGLLSKTGPRVDFVPFACFLFGVALIMLDFFSDYLGIELVILFLAGCVGGFYQVPLDAYIQINSPNEKRGVFIGTTSLLSFLGVLVSSILLYLLNMIGLKPDQGFTLMGLATCSLSFILFKALRKSTSFPL